MGLVLGTTSQNLLLYHTGVPALPTGHKSEDSEIRVGKKDPEANVATICLDMYPVQRYLGEQEQKLQISTHTNFLVCFEMVSHIAHRQILNS